MKAHVLGASGSALNALVRMLEGQGVGVSTAEPVPSGLDLYVFILGHETMRGIRDGLTVLDLRTDTARSSAGWVAYADLCLVGDAPTRTFLVEHYGYEPERIFVVPDDATLAGVMRQALDGTVSSVPVSDASTGQIGGTSAGMVGTLVNHLAALESTADVAPVQRPATQRLSWPDRLMAWLGGQGVRQSQRDDLDRVLERQVAFNKDLLAALRQVVHVQAGLEVRLADRERGVSVADREPPVIEIRDPAIDGEAIARQVYEQAAQRAYGPSAADAGPERLRESHPEPRLEAGVNPAVLRAGVAKFLASGELGEPDFVSQAPVIAPLIVAVRRFWNWMSTKWYVRPLVAQQTRVNREAGYLISELAQWRELDARRLARLEARVAELEQRVRDVEAS